MRPTFLPESQPRRHAHAEPEELPAAAPTCRVLLQDLGTLFSAANGYAQIALLDVEADHAAREALEMLARVLWRAQAVSHGLASEDATGACVLRPLDARRMAREAVEAGEALAPPQVSVRLRVPREPVSVRGDSNLLLRVLVNLVGNGLEALEGRSGHVDVIVEGPTPNHPGEAAIVVRDDGCGMDGATLREARKLVFSDAERDGRGGLGLWLADRVAQRHGGRLELRSARGAGTEARLLLPSCA